MCDHCGCSGPAPAHEHDHHHEHEHGHHHHDPGEETRTLALHQSLMARNDRLAAENRGFFKGRGTLTLNLVSSPGSGRT